MSERMPREWKQCAGDFPAETYVQTISVPFEYPVHFTRRVFHPRNPLLADTLNRLGENRVHRAAVFVDEGVAEAHPTLLTQIGEYFHERPDQVELAGGPVLVPGGPAAKRGWEPVRSVMWRLGNWHMDRQSFVVAVGGGSMLDMVGFGASIVHRGLRMVRVPSTTLAQNDAGIGVKTGMDEHGQKNFVGTFAPPFAVINDFAFLPTLSDEHWLAGVAEALKVAIIKDAAFFAWLADSAPALAARSEAAMAECVRRCAVLHLEHIRTSGDPFECGSARPLDFGHWAGHRLEILSDYRLSHGQAVAVGIALDSAYARAKGLLGEEELEGILAALEASGLPTWHELLTAAGPEGRPAVLDGLAQFREHLGGRLCVTLPRGIGRKVEVNHMDEEAVLAAAEQLSARARSRSR